MVLAALACTTPQVEAQEDRAHAHTELINFDLRNQPVDANAKLSTTGNVLAAAAKASAPVERIKGAQIDRPTTPGTPLYIRSTHQFLTGPDGAGTAVDAAALQAIPSNDPHRTVKAFIDSNAPVFGHQSSLLDSASVKADYVTPHNGLRTVVWEQSHNGISIFESNLKAHLTARGELISIASSLVSDPLQATQNGSVSSNANATTRTLSAQQAVAIAAQNIGETISLTDLTPANSPKGAECKQRFQAPQLTDAEVRFVWLPMDASTLRQCWEVLLTSKARGELYRLIIDAETGQVVVRHCLTNDIGPASYRVFTSDSPSPFSPGLATPLTIQPAPVTRSLVTLSALDTTASPNGWIDDSTTETLGNNVDAHTDTNADNIADLPRPQATSTARVFDPALDLNQAPSTYKDAAVVNLFYWCNWMHDRLYQLGFNEASGNFQTNNFGHGGAGNDAVQADAQDGSGTNNANFSTPPDGSPGRMQMYVFTGSSPDRDGDFDTEIILHEYTHGLSNRLVGGGVGITALQSRGMGEGWSDFYALALLSETTDDLNGNYATGGYATYLLTPTFTQNYYFGIRRYPYSTDLTKNPLTFKDIDPVQASAHTGVPLSPARSNYVANSVHSMGEVWCVTLWDARANLVTKHGYAIGNQLILQLVTDGMKLAPANPNFLQARDAILQADRVNNAGANKTELWAAFIKRGMGADAYSPASSTTTDLIEDYSQPNDLSVGPFAVTKFSGQMGSAINTATQTYTLTNTGTAPLSWTATKTQDWLTLNATSGTLAADASTTVIATVNSAAANLAAGTFTETISFNNLTSGGLQARLVSLTMNPPRAVFYPLDTNPGWPATGEWEFGQPTGAGGTLHGYPDPTSGATGTNVIGVNLNGDYSTTYTTGITYVTAGPFNLTNLSNTRLQFQRRLNCDFQPYVFATLEVSRDGTSWTQIWNNGTTALSESTWTKVQYNIAAVADNQSTVYIRWSHRVGATSLVFAYSGWNIDDVEILGSLTATTTPAVNLAASATTASIGQTISFTTTASCTTGIGQLGLEACDSAGTPTSVLNSATVSGTSPTQTFTWTPTASGTYYFVGYAQDSTLTTTTRSTPIITVTVKSTTAAPTFTPASGNFTSAQSISLTSATPGATIRYTVNGDAPTSTTGTLYTAPFSITASSTVKAIAYATNLNDSPVTKGIYTLLIAPNNLTTPTSQTVNALSTVTLNASAAGSPTPTYLWQVSTDTGTLWTNLSSLPPYSGATSPTLTITSIPATFNGYQYRYIATNTSGSATSNAATLIIAVAPPAFLTQPTDLVVLENSAINLLGTASSATTITYQWYKDNVALTGNTNNIYSKATATVSDSGKYKIAATNSVGTTNSREATVTVSPPILPAFIIQPQSQNAYVGDSITFVSSATGLPSPTYQWYKNGTAITSATASSLALPGLTLTNNGESYTVKITNSAGTVTSTAATLNIYATDSSKALGLSPATRTIGCGRVVYPLTLRTNNNWTATKSANWITLSATSGKKSRSLEVTAAPNPLSTERTATITIGQQTHTLTQRAAGTPTSELWAVGSNDFGQLGDYRYPPITYPAIADTDVQSIAAGNNHTLYVKTDGTLLAVGANTYSQLGNGTVTDQLTPVQITTNVASAAAGWYHSAFLKRDGTLWTCGSNFYGQLGDGTTAMRTNPVPIATGVTAVAIGTYQTFFIKTDGSLWAAGYNNYGQLGNGTTTNQNLPIQIATGVASVSSGYAHTLFVKTDGTLWVTGYNAFGQLGDGTTSNRTTPYQLSTDVKASACGYYHSLFLKTDGSLFGMGYNSYGQLGDGSTATRTSPVASATGVQSITCGRFHSLFIKTDGSLWATGENPYYKLGNGSTTNQLTPVKIADNVSTTSAGYNHSLFLKTDNTLWAVGANTNGQLGYASPGTELRSTPICVASEIKSAAGGDNHSLFLKDDGSVWSVGENSAGQLADGTTFTRCDPAQIATGIKAVTAGDNHSFLLKSDGSLLAVGANTRGQLGDASNTLYRTTPVQIATAINATSAGITHSLLQKTDGSLLTTGDNTYGQLGNGTNNSQGSPSQIATEVTSIATGASHTLYVKAGATLWSAGYNSYGQLGNGNTTNQPTPIQIAGTYLSAAAGDRHSLLRKTDNTVWACGYNGYGQLGDATYTSRTAPVQALTNVKSIACGKTHSLFLKNDATLWTTGDGSSGQLGNGNYSSRSTPTAIAANVQNIYAGGAHTLFLASGDIRVTPTVAPTITSFSPAIFSDGSVITISGNNFGTSPTVYFNSVAAASYTTITFTQLTVVAPAGLTEGKIIVNTADGSATSSTSYTLGTSPTPSAPKKKGGAPNLWSLAALLLISLARFATIQTRRN